MPVTHDELLALAPPIEVLRSIRADLAANVVNGAPLVTIDGSKSGETSLPGQENPSGQVPELPQARPRAYNGVERKWTASTHQDFPCVPSAVQELPSNCG